MAVAPRGGCWIPSTVTSTSYLSSFLGGQLPGTAPTQANRPSQFIPGGHTLPAGVTQYAVMYSATNQDRVINYVPFEYTPPSIARLRAIQADNLARVPGLLAEGILRLDEVAEYVRTRGLTQANLRTLDNASEFLLRPGEIYIGKPVIVIFNVGTTAAERREMLQAILSDIEEALDGS